MRNVQSRFAGYCVLGLAVILAGCGGGSGTTSTGTTPPQTTPAAAPTFSLAAGTYTSVQTVTIADATAGASIYYTVDGSAPSTQSLLYSGPITVSISETVSAFAIASGYSGSTAASAAYNINLPAGAPLTGTVYSGTQILAGTHVYLFAAGATGYGQPSISLLDTGSTGNVDSVGAYAQTTNNGTFSMTGDYSCAAGQQLYLYALSGSNQIAGTNPSIGMLAAIGSCHTAGPPISATINEVTTVAAAYALAGFATDATHISSSGTALAQIGIANAFATAGNLANLTTGAALTTTPSGNGSAVPQTNINLIADILAACVNTQSSCSTLFSSATSDSTVNGTKPTDTATAAINIAHYPAANYTALTGLVGNTPTFTPITPLFFTGTANQLSLPIVYTADGTGNTGNIAIDGAGDVWFTGKLANNVVEISPTGVPLSGAGGFSAASMISPSGLAIDSSGNAWVPAQAANAVTEFSSNGTVLSGTNGFSGGGIQTPVAVATDGSGNAWIANAVSGSNSVSKLSSAGTPVSPSTGYVGGGINNPDRLAIDGSGNAWVTNFSGSTVTEISNSGSYVSGSVGYLLGAGSTGPNGIAFDASGTAWISNATGSNVVEITSSGSVSSVPVSGLNAPSDVAIDGSGNGWIVQLTALTKFTKSGTVLGSFGGNTTATGPLLGYRIAVDGSGNVWSLCTNGSLVEWVGVATPVVTPLATGAKNNTLATRP